MLSRPDPPHTVRGGSDSVGAIGETSDSYRSRHRRGYRPYCLNCLNCLNLSRGLYTPPQCVISEVIHLEGGRRRGTPSDSSDSSDTSIYKKGSSYILYCLNIGAYCLRCLNWARQALADGVSAQPGTPPPTPTYGAVSVLSEVGHA